MSKPKSKASPRHRSVRPTPSATPSAPALRIPRVLPFAPNQIQSIADADAAIQRAQAELRKEVNRAADTFAFMLGIPYEQFIKLYHLRDANVGFELIDVVQGESPVSQEKPNLSETEVQPIPNE